MSVPAADKSYRYFITFIDDLSRYNFIERKDMKSIAEKYQEWRAEAENKSGNVVSYLQTDEGGEYEKEMTIVLKWSRRTQHILHRHRILINQTVSLKYSIGNSKMRDWHIRTIVHSSKTNFHRLTNSLLSKWNLE